MVELESNCGRHATPPTCYLNLKEEKNELNQNVQAQKINFK
jgi:hypothetical protein